MEYSRIVAGLMRVRSLISPASNDQAVSMGEKLKVDELVGCGRCKQICVLLLVLQIPYGEQWTSDISSEQPKGYEASLIDLKRAACTQTSCYKISVAAWYYERICLTAPLFSQAHYSALSDSTHLLDSAQNKRCFPFRLWGLRCGSHSTCRSDTLQLASGVSQTIPLWLHALCLLLFPIPVGVALSFAKLITLCSLCLCIVLLE